MGSSAEQPLPPLPSLEGLYDARAGQELVNALCRTIRYRMQLDSSSATPVTSNKLVVRYLHIRRQLLPWTWL